MGCLRLGRSGERSWAKVLPKEETYGKEVLPQYREAAREERKCKMRRKLVSKDRQPKDNNWVSWAYLLKRVFDVDECEA